MVSYKRWTNVPEIVEKSFSCWDCSNMVAGNRGYRTEGNANIKRIYICPNCSAPNYFDYKQNQIPGPKYGNQVEHLPPTIKEIYDETRDCYSVGSFTGSALLSRKILMNIAVEKGADENKKFAYYVDWLSENNYLPPDGKQWVDHIRKIGNQGTHEIKSVTCNDAMELINFCEMLLKFVFEFPTKMQKNIPKEE